MPLKAVRCASEQWVLRAERADPAVCHALRMARTSCPTGEESSSRRWAQLLQRTPPSLAEKEALGDGAAIPLPQETHAESWGLMPSRRARWISNQ